MSRALLLASLLTACSSNAPEPATTPPDPSDHVFGGARPVETFRVPSSYDPSKPAPLVLVLHGYGASGLLQSLYFGLSALVEEKGFILAAPDGTPDSTSKRYWNALDFCCGTDVDDVAYLLGLVDEIEKYYAIDRKRVFLVGHSNGAAMSYRLACEAADRFGAMVSLGGTFYLDPKKCTPNAPIAVREMHGSADEVIPFDGGLVTLPTPGGPKATLPSATAIVEAWASYNACATKGMGDPLDVDQDVAGKETLVTRWTGCKPNAEVELWDMQGTKHVPLNLSKDLGRMIWSFLEAHPRP
ncbi:MAG: alpha/beta hydrolase family esterase [Polyangiales bacterium]